MYKTIIEFKEVLKIENVNIINIDITDLILMTDRMTQIIVLANAMMTIDPKSAIKKQIEASFGDAMEEFYNSFDCDENDDIVFEDPVDLHLMMKKLNNATFYDMVEDNIFDIHCSATASKWRNAEWHFNAMTKVYDTFEWLSQYNMGLMSHDVDFIIKNVWHIKVIYNHLDLD